MSLRGPGRRRAAARRTRRRRGGRRHRSCAAARAAASADPQRTSSPAAWPWLSLTYLKLSRSSTSRAPGPPRAAPSGRPRLQLLLEVAAVGHAGQRVGLGEVLQVAARPAQLVARHASARAARATSSCMVLKLAAMRAELVGGVHHHVLRVDLGADAARGRPTARLSIARVKSASVPVASRSAADGDLARRCARSPRAATSPTEMVIRTRRRRCPRARR